MNILFIHQNFPGQFKHLAPALQARGHKVAALTAEKNQQKTPIPTYRYTMPFTEPDPRQARLGTTFIVMTDRAHRVALAAVHMRDKLGFVPDVILGHCGWGETLFLREVWPQARILVYAEFFYATEGLDVGFDPEFSKLTLPVRMSVTSRQAHLALAMVQADAALAPTEWQADSFPPEFRAKITITHDGVDTDTLRPDPQAQYTLPDGRVLRAGDEVLTYVARNIEPYRGSHIFLRALPEVLAARPEAQVVIIGNDGVSYSSAPKQGSWRDVFMDEVRDRLDLSRVHFLGSVPYRDYVTLLQIGRVHAYLTVPFVLSWSMLEAMSLGALVVGSRTGPVEEVITDGVNGCLVDFFDVEGWSDALIAALSAPARFQPMREMARRTIVDNHDLRRICLPRLIRFVEQAGQEAV
ncbi:glycosyltransferase involved in cell wall biosynthesis [Roseinatronobacter thiooxidans]|uniref:Glycosyltransferase involved in cell wall biosynthesis n=1 Tax=Roseinatronobacter thiooxidans TaxID=121821 RepID=A0A2W7QUL1_9RHOB|nr:glycosyltransferase [Roseinatronobacter thiooxidans]PZX42105.1 glycosyltransferase involved in cell wall biosynthesis [Roseinatronobacter thiooxidans]